MCHHISGVARLVGSVGDGAKLGRLVWARDPNKVTYFYGLCAQLAVDSAAEFLVYNCLGADCSAHNKIRAVLPAPVVLPLSSKPTVPLCDSHTFPMSTWPHRAPPQVPGGLLRHWIPTRCHQVCPI